MRACLPACMNNVCVRACSRRTRSSHRRVDVEARVAVVFESLLYQRLLHSPDRFLPFILIDIIYTKEKYKKSRRYTRVDYSERTHIHTNEQRDFLKQRIGTQ